MAPLWIALKKSLDHRPVHQESFGATLEASRSGARVATTPSGKVPPVAVSAGEQIEGTSGAPGADVVRSGVVMMSQAEMASSTAPMTDVTRPGAVVTSQIETAASAVPMMDVAWPGRRRRRWNSWSRRPCRRGQCS
jgi:hypothetical protein